jgi:hypothetical protein
MSTLQACEQRLHALLWSSWPHPPLVLAVLGVRIRPDNTVGTAPHPSSSSGTSACPGSSAYITKLSTSLIGSSAPTATRKPQHGCRMGVLECSNAPETACVESGHAGERMLRHVRARSSCCWSCCKLRTRSWGCSWPVQYSMDIASLTGAPPFTDSSAGRPCSPAIRLQHHKRATTLAVKLLHANQGMVRMLLSAKACSGALKALCSCAIALTSWEPLCATHGACAARPHAYCGLQLEHCHDIPDLLPSISEPGEGWP